VCNRDFFKEMQEEYDIKSLNSELVESQLSGFGLSCNASKIDDKLYYELGSDNKSEWILNGYIRLVGDSLMFLENEDAGEQLFLDFDIQKGKSWDISLNSGSKALMTYRGKLYDDIRKDSLLLYEVQQFIKREFKVSHAPQLSWIAANRDGGIVLLSYTTQLNDLYTIRLSPQLEVIKYKN